MPAIQLGHTGRKGSEQNPWDGKRQIAPDHADGWQVRGPSAITYGGRYTYPVQELTVAEIHALHRAYADAARRALAAGFEWLEMHFAHGYLGASFFSPLANQRTDEYGGSLENRLRFHREALDAVRAVWPERLPLTMRLGSDDFHPDGVQFDDSVWAVGELKRHGLDLADISLGMNTDDMRDPPFSQAAFMVERGNRVRRECGIPVAVSWNLGTPAVADRVIREELIDLVFLGRPALANPHWPVWAARELAHDGPVLAAAAGLVVVAAQPAGVGELARVAGAGDGLTVRGRCPRAPGGGRRCLPPEPPSTRGPRPLDPASGACGAAPGRGGQLPLPVTSRAEGAGRRVQGPRAPGGWGSGGRQSLPPPGCQGRSP